VTPLHTDKQHLEDRRKQGFMGGNDPDIDILFRHETVKAYSIEWIGQIVKGWQNAGRVTHDHTNAILLYYLQPMNGQF